MKEGDLCAIDIGELAIQPPFWSVVMRIFAEGFLATVHMVRAEGDAGILWNEYRRFPVCPAALGEQCRSERESGVHGHLWLEAESCSRG